MASLHVGYINHYQFVLTSVVSNGADIASYSKVRNMEECEKKAIDE